MSTRKTFRVFGHGFIIGSRPMSLLIYCRNERQPKEYGGIGVYAVNGKPNYNILLLELERLSGHEVSARFMCSLSPR